MQGKRIITVGARSSPLSLVQTQEVLSELQKHHPEVEFDLIPMKTLGDNDQTTSLRNLNKTDFFTREIDQLLLSEKCRIAIHSAKDLPEPLPRGLSLVALTKGIDPSDSLVLLPGMTLENLSTLSRIATSSIRREESIKRLRSDLTFVDIRGTIQERLDKLNKGEIEGVVIAEAALIRLKLTHLNRIKLPDFTVPFQGRLAILARDNDEEMRKLFLSIHHKTVLHTGLEPYASINENCAHLHIPFIHVVPRPKLELDVSKYSHFIFTSKSAVKLFFSHYQEPYLLKKTFLAVGTSTAASLRKQGVENILTAVQEHAEGVVELLKTLNLSNAFMLWPHAAGSRDVISDYLKSSHIQHDEVILYDTVSRKPDPAPHLALIDEITFTSPSTVDSFVEFYGTLPQNKILKAIGPITEKHIERILL
jgi:hydroxymethylbilane synthase